MPKVAFFINPTIRHFKKIEIDIQRQMSIENWLALIEIDPPLSNNVVNSRIDQFKDVIIPDTTTLLTNWLKHEN